MKKKMTFREWAKQPYTKGDYYGGIAVMLGLYGLAIGGCLLYKLNEADGVGKELASETAKTIREAYTETKDEA
jgi:hypothetical protein